MTTSLLDLPITRSLPALRVERLTPAQHNLWSVLPPSYQEFLLARNGGFVEDDGHSDLCFHTGVPYYEEDGVKRLESNVDSVSEFFGFRIREDAKQSPPATSAPQPCDLAELQAEHDSEGFLPLGVIAVAAAHESLVCISTRTEDHGAVYYWDYYWDYPWSEEFFDPRVKGAERSFPNLAAIKIDPKHPQRQEASDALNYATLVFLANDFGTWLRSCWMGESEV